MYGMTRGVAISQARPKTCAWEKIVTDFGHLYNSLPLDIIHYLSARASPLFPPAIPSKETNSVINTCLNDRN